MDENKEIEKVNDVPTKKVEAPEQAINNKSANHKALIQPNDDVKKKLFAKEKEIQKERFEEVDEVNTDIDRIIERNAAPKGKDRYKHNADKSVVIGMRLKVLGIIISFIMTLVCVGAYGCLFAGIFDSFKEFIPELFTTEGLLVVFIAIVIALIFVWTFGFLIVAAGQNLIDKALMLEEFRKISNTIKSIDNH